MTAPFSNDALRLRWHALLARAMVKVDAASLTFDDLCTHYGEPGRYYHTLTHVGNVLDTVERLTTAKPASPALLLAAWLHDVIYDSRANDNEERSAAYARRLCETLALPEADRVAALILATKTHQAGDERETQILLDADLAILGADEPTYRAYAENIRREYAWVPENDYCAGRRKVLMHFLARPHLFHFLHTHEATARRNLAEEIAGLDRA